METEGETEGERAERLHAESEARRIADLIKKELPKGRVFILLTADVGKGGNAAYTSNMARGDAVRFLTETLDYWSHEGMAATTPDLELTVFLREQVAQVRSSPKATEKELVTSLAKIAQDLAEGRFAPGADAGTSALLLATEALVLFDLVVHP